MDIHFRQHRRAGLGRAGLLIVHQVGKLLPALDVFRRVVDQPRDDAVRARRRELDRGRIAMKRVLAARQNNRKQIGKVRAGPAAVGQRKTAAEQQQAAAAPVDELADQVLLRQREVARFDRADDESLKAEKILGARGKAVGQFFGIVDALAIDFVFGGAQHGGDLHDPVVVFGAADEFVFPARLAFHIEDAALVRFDVDQARDGIVRAILLAGQRIDARIAAFSRRPRRH